MVVSNLVDSNHLYHNNGDGTFTDVAETTRTAEPLNSFPDSSLTWGVNGYEYGFRRVLARLPEAQERDLLLDVLSRQQQRLSQDDDLATQLAATDPAQRTNLALTQSTIASMCMTCTPRSFICWVLTTRS